MRPPSTARRWPTALFLLALTSSSCGPDPQQPVARAPPLQIHLDERPVLVGDVIERIEADSYVYLRLSIISDSSTPSATARAPERWVAIEGDAPTLGERIRVRSLARRSHVWEPSLGRDFEVLEYVAMF